MRHPPINEFESSYGSDVDSGPDHEQGQSDRQEFEAARLTARVLNGIAWPLLILAWLAPTPYPIVVVVLATLPLSAIVLAIKSKGLYQLLGLRSTTQPGLGPAFLGCALILFVRALKDINVLPLQWVTVLLTAITVGGVLTLIIIRSGHRSPEGQWALILLVASIYAYGLVIEVDALLDHSTPETSAVAVLGKRSSNGRGGTTYYIQVSKWGPFEMQNDVLVSREVFDSIYIGETICINLRPGALRIPWYSVAICRPTERGTS